MSGAGRALSVLPVAEITRTSGTPEVKLWGPVTCARGEDSPAASGGMDVIGWWGAAEGAAGLPLSSSVPPSGAVLFYLMRLSLAFHKVMVCFNLF